MRIVGRLVARCNSGGLWVRERILRLLFPSVRRHAAEIAGPTDALINALLQHASDFITILNENGTILYESPAVMKLLAYDREELVGQSVFQFVHPEDLPGVLETFRKGIRTLGFTVTFQCRFRKRDGSWRLLEVTGTNLLDDPLIHGIVVNSRDVTDRERVERERILMSHALESITEAVVIADIEDTILFVNNAFLTMYQYRNDEIVGQDIEVLRSTKNSAEVVQQIYPATIEGGWQGELLNRKKDGTEFPIYLSTGVIHDAEGGIAALIGVSTDVSERKHADENLRRTLSLLAATLESTADGILVVDELGHIVSYNQQFAVMWKIPMEVLESKSDERALGFVMDQLDNPQVFLGKVLELYNSPDDESFDVLTFKDGRVFERFSKPQRIEGVSVGRVWSFRDVTERRKAEQLRRKLEEQFRSLFEESKDAVYISTPEGKFLDINPAGVKLFGYASREELEHIDIEKDLFADPSARARYGKELERNGFVKDYELVLRKKDGTSVIVLETGSAVRDEHDTIVAYRGILRDITDDYRMRENLKDSEERYRRFFQDDITGDFISTPSGRIIECNPAFARIFGFASVDEALKANANTFYPSMQARHAYLNLLRERKRLENYEIEARRKDGKPLYAIENVIGTFNEEGELVEIKGYLFDNTERKRLEDELRQSQKMEGIGTLAGGIAHDFNNILGIIMVTASRLRKEVANTTERTGWAETILKAVDRGSGLTRQLLTFARKTEVHFEPLNVNEVVTDLVKLLQETFPRTITFSLRLAGSIPLISADRNQINQALLNLCVNARDAMPEGGVLGVSTSVVDRSVLPKSSAEVSGSHFIDLSVTDTGTGMDGATKDRIFEPFLTTKERGRGTGLGLAVVYGVVKSHNGLVTVESSKGFGSTFHLFFPMISICHVPPAEVPEEEKNVPGGNERILFVEDEEDLRSGMIRLLQEKGYTVHPAGDGEQAVSVYRHLAPDIDVVVLDLGLPKLGGWDVLRKILDKKSGIKVVVASGYFDPVVKTKLEAVGVRHLIQKPYSSATLLRSIRSAVDHQENPSSRD